MGSKTAMKSLLSGPRHKNSAVSRVKTAAGRSKFHRPSRLLEKTHDFWANYNISLTWIQAMKGDASPY